MRIAVIALPITATLFLGAIFGFFYAWICSTMWAFDLLEPALAIKVMNAINANIRNPVFFPAFMLTPVVCLAAAGTLFYAGQRRPALWFGAATLVYFGGGMMLTMLVNVPMNRALAEVTIPATASGAAEIWQAYSPRWQFWNQTRTVMSGCALILASIGLVEMHRRPSST